MAIRNTIFRSCNDVTQTVVLQYNDIFFTVGQTAFYNGNCWIDSGIESDLIPLADVTFNNYDDCETCFSFNFDGVLLEKCSNTSQKLVISVTPGLLTNGSVIELNGECWSYVSTTGATTNFQQEPNIYLTCETCSSVYPSGTTEYSATTFVNCCDDTDVVTFNVIRDNFVYPFGDTVIYNNKCYKANLLGTPGVIVSSFEFPEYLSCTTCAEVIPCGTPVPTPTVTSTNTPTPTPTPSYTPTHTPTLTPTKTPGLTPTATYTTTTTTRATSVNECDVVTLFPLGVSCNAVNPLTPTGLGSLSITITGGTPPYTIIWNDGTNPPFTGTTTLSNVTSGTYTITVIDYYKDFTGTTTCSIVAPSPTPTTTPTPTITPSPTPTAYTGICVTFVVDSVQQNQVQFDYYTTINGKPAWSAASTNTSFSTTGGTLILSYTSNGIWSITGTQGSNLIDTATFTSTTSSIPPLNGWTINGQSNITSMTATLGDCPTYTPMIMQTFTNSTSCSGVNDGSITIQTYGGSGSYVYSFNNGVTTGTTNYVQSIAAGTYIVRTYDTVTGLYVSESVTVTSLSQSQTYVLSFGLTSANQAGSSYSNLVYTLNNDEILPSGITLNLTLDVATELKQYEPGVSNNSGSYILISKNNTPLNLTSNGSSTSSANRPYCSPSQIDTTTSGATVTTSLTNADTLTVQLVSQVGITDYGDGECATGVQYIQNVNGSYTYTSSPCQNVTGTLQLNSAAILPST